jgi:hypothetical protein
MFSVEVGAEPGQTHYAGVAARFAELRTFRFGMEPDFPARTVLVANEFSMRSLFIASSAKAGFGVTSAWASIARN